MIFIDMKTQFIGSNRDFHHTTLKNIYNVALIHELKFERLGKNNLNEAKIVRNLVLKIKLTKNKARMRIKDLNQSPNKQTYEFPSNL